MNKFFQQDFTSSALLWGQIIAKWLGDDEKSAVLPPGCSTCRSWKLREFFVDYSQMDFVLKNKPFLENYLPLPPNLIGWQLSKDVYYFFTRLKRKNKISCNIFCFSLPSENLLQGVRQKEVRLLKNYLFLRWDLRSLSSWEGWMVSI